MGQASAASRSSLGCLMAGVMIEHFCEDSKTPSRNDGAGYACTLLSITQPHQ